VAASPGEHPISRRPRRRCGRGGKSLAWPPLRVWYKYCEMQTLADAQHAGGGRPPADPASGSAVDAVLTTSRSLIAVATWSLGAAADETTLAQYRALVVLSSRGQLRVTGLADALDVAPSTAGRMCDRLVRKGLVRRHRDRHDRRAVLVAITAAGRHIVDQATERRCALIAEILGRLPAVTQQQVAQALRAFADAAGEIPDSQWPAGVPGADLAAPHGRGQDRARPMERS
jgi:DNA-binding MarR family transcriptional regulator